MSYVIFLCILVGLILVHELGHFLVAKAFKIRVDEFGIFFPPRLFAKKFGETEYSVNMIPLGGFVRIFGENPKDGASDPRSLSRKSRFVQAAVLVAGITFNILFAWLALSVGYMVGMQTSVDHAGFGQVQNAHVLITEVVPGSPADKAGIKPNDVLDMAQTGTAMLGEHATADQVQSFIFAHQDESLVVTLSRGGKKLNLLAKPTEGIVPGHKAIGVAFDDVGVLKLPPHVALAEGAILTERMTVAVAQGLGGFFMQLVRGAANWGGVAGPVGIAGIGSAAVKTGFAATIILTAMISINLAIVNLLPIPGLDGGRLLIVAIEGIIRRPLPEKWVMRATIAGFSLLALLMIVITFHDILHLIRT